MQSVSLLPSVEVEMIVDNLKELRGLRNSPGLYLGPHGQLVQRNFESSRRNKLRFYGIT